jgi:hypothetical protein
VGMESSTSLLQECLHWANGRHRCHRGSWSGSPDARPEFGRQLFQRLQDLLLQGERVLKTGLPNAVSEIPASASTYLSVVLTSGRRARHAAPVERGATAVGHSGTAVPSVVDTHR